MKEVSRRPRKAAVLSTATQLALDESVTPEQLARALHIHVRTVYRMMDRGEIPSIRAGRVRRIPGADARRVLAGQARA